MTKYYHFNIDINMCTLAFFDLFLNNIKKQLFIKYPLHKFTSVKELKDTEFVTPDRNSNYLGKRYFIIFLEPLFKD